jgi:RNA polymerase sigma factor (sigma-70 family)
MTAEELATKYLPMARRVAYAWGRRFRYLWDEFESAAVLALWSCARRYDPTRGSFHGWAAARINGACRDACRDARPKGFRRADHAAVLGGLAEPEFVAGLPDEDGVPSLDNLTDDALPVGWELESADAVESLTAGLPFAEREAVRMYFLDAGATNEVVARALGCGMTYASTRRAAGMRRLRDTCRGR